MNYNEWTLNQIPNYEEESDKITVLSCENEEEKEEIYNGSTLNQSDLRDLRYLIENCSMDWSNAMWVVLMNKRYPNQLKEVLTKISEISGDNHEVL